MSRTRNRRGRAAVAVLGLLTLTVLPSRTFAGDRVVLVSWDGIRRDVLKSLIQWQPLGEVPRPCPDAHHDPIMPSECNGYQSCLPTICRFQIVDSAVTEGKPLTRPQHAQMLSGYGPQETGEITNAGRRSLPPGMSIYERIAEGRNDVFTVHIAGRKYVGAGIIRWASRSGALKLDLRRGARDAYTGVNTNEKLGPAFDAIGSSPFFLFAHYKAADVLAHSVGDGGDQYREAIMQNDQRLGELLELLEERGLLATTEIFVTTDHGFHGIFHVNANDPLINQTWFASYRPKLDRNATSVLDVTPTILRELGISLETEEPPYRGSALVP